MKKVFITGGTSGIGWAIAQQYLAHNYRVGIGSRFPNKEVKDFSNYANLEVFTIDVTDKDDLQAAITTFAKGNLEVLIANAGCYFDSALEVISYEDSKAMLDTNIRGTLNTLEIGRDLMINKGGKIAVIASISSLLKHQEATIYSQTKKTIYAIAQSYNRALRDYNIKVLTICPGYVATAKLYELNSNDLSKKQYVISPGEAAKIIYKGIEDNQKLIVFPKRMYRLIKLLNSLPSFLLNKIMYKKAQWQKKK